MALQVQKIRVTWRPHPDELLRGNEVWVPKLTAQVVDERLWGMTKVVLAPFAKCSVLPFGIAQEYFDGDGGSDSGGGDVETYLHLPHFQDPLLPHLDLWYWGDTRSVQVVGENLGEHLLLRLPLAFDSSQKLDSVILDQHFFQQVRVLLDPRAGAESWIETIA